MGRVDTAREAASDTAVPPRSAWPTPPESTTAGRLVTDAVLETFRLNARFLDVGGGLAARGGLTSAWWQVLGGVLDGPHSVADVARSMGMTRQGVQRVADLLVDRGLAEYQDNPAHRRAKLLACTEAGYWAVRRISLAQHPWADRVGTAVGVAELATMVTTMRRLLDVLDSGDTEGTDTEGVGAGGGKPDDRSADG